jgi:hypothetical protein
MLNEELGMMNEIRVTRLGELYRMSSASGRDTAVCLAGYLQDALQLDF